MSDIILTAEDLAKVQVPAKTKSYSPVSHGDVINMTMEALDKANLKVTSQFYRMASDGRKAFGAYQISGSEDPEMNIRLMWHNSYNKTMPLRWAIGAHVIVCENGMVSGDIGAFKRKHTGSVVQAFKEDVELHVAKAGEMFQSLVNDREKLKNIQVTKKTVAELVGRMYIEEALVNVTQLAIIKREIEVPTYDYKADGSAWQLYNHVTVALKESHPHNHIAQHMGTHKFFAREFGIK